MENKTVPGNIGSFVGIISENKILLLKKNYSNKFWTLPGGKLELGESILAGAQRELKEETGLSLDNLNWLQKNVCYITKEQTIAFCYVVYLDKCDTNIVLSPNEHSDFNWFTRDELPLEISKYTKDKIENMFNSEPFKLIEF